MAASLEDVARRAVSDLAAAARLHKRSEAFHRTQAKRMQASLAEIRLACEEAGISLVIEHKDPEGGSHSGRTSQRAD